MPTSVMGWCPSGSGTRRCASMNFHTIAKNGMTATITSLPGPQAPIGIYRLLPPVMGTMLEFAPRGRFPAASAGSAPRVSTRSTPACCASVGPDCRPGGGFRSS